MEKEAVFPQTAKRRLPTQKIRWLFIGSKFLSSPLHALYGILLFIFCKDLQATPFQISLLVSAKPLVALLSFYANLFIQGKPSRLRPFLMISYLVGLLPCFFFPLMDSIWFFLFAFALFMLSAKARAPAWTEVLKITLSQEQRAHFFSQGSVVSYLISIVVPLLVAPFIDLHPGTWRWFFVAAAILQALNTLLIFFLPIRPFNDPVLPYRALSLQSLVVEPWKNVYLLMKQRPDFRKFQIAFFLGGGGLMLMLPTLPLFFEKTLHLSYTQVSMAKYLCNSFAFACTSPIWAHFLNRISIYRFNSFVTLFAALFSGFILASSSHIGWFYAAYFVYGLMQAGSELSWNLSGPLFAKEQDSTLYTGINVAMVGIRGAIAPFIGGLLFLYSNATTVFLVGGFFCLSGSLFSLLSEKNQSQVWVD